MSVISYAEAASKLTEELRRWEKSRSDVPEVLEAGGGSLSKVTFAIDTNVTVIDISQEQLDRNEYATTKILGDLHTVEVTQSFDAVVCYDVIEHLDRPAVVVDRLCTWLKPGGLLVIAAPNRLSLAGIITRLSPHWFHVWVHRVMFKNDNAGKPGHAPFRTYHRPEIAPERLAQRLAETDGMTVSSLIAYEGDRRAYFAQSSPLIGGAYSLFNIGLAAVLGQHLRESDFFLVAVKH